MLTSRLWHPFGPHKGLRLILSRIISQVGTHHDFRPLFSPFGGGRVCGHIDRAPAPASICPTPIPFPGSGRPRSRPLPWCVTSFRGPKSIRRRIAPNMRERALGRQEINGLPGRRPLRARNLIDGEAALGSRRKRQDTTPLISSRCTR